MSQREGPRVIFLRKICRSGPQPRPESSGSRCIESWPPPPPLRAWREPPPPRLAPRREVLPRVVLPQGVWAESDPCPHPIPRQPDSHWERSLGFICTLGTLFRSQSPPGHGARGDGRGNPSELPGGGVIPIYFALPPIFSVGSPTRVKH